MAKGKKPPKGKPVKAISPLAPKSFAHLPPLAGVRLATGEAGIKYKDRTDVLLAMLAPGSQVAGVFTRSKTASAPVEWCRAQLQAGRGPRPGGQQRQCQCLHRPGGQAGVRAVAETAAAVVGCKASEVFLASTGVIGEPLPSEKITKILTKVADDASASGWRAAAEAIMTTDTFPKLATASATIDGIKVTINGIAKGSGMIAPDMATMLAFVFTDASLPAPGAAGLLRAGRDAVVQFHHGGFRHLHQRHAASVRHRQRGQAWRGRQGVGQEARRFPPKP